MIISFRFTVVLQVMLLSLVGCASSRLPSPADSGVGLKLTPTNNNVLIEISNATPKDIVLENLDGLSLLPDQPGFVFKIIDGNGKQHVLCSMVEPGVSNQMVLLKSGSSKHVSFSNAYITRIYCLDGGRYAVQAILHLPQSAPGKLRDIASDKVLLDMTHQ